ncbi:hypothetical protein, partial [Cedecea sp. VD27]
KLFNLKVFDAQRIKTVYKISSHSSRLDICLHPKMLRYQSCECPHRLSDKLLKSSATFSVARAVHITLSRCVVKHLFFASLRLTRRFASRCSVSVEAHYREFFAGDKRLFKKTF